MKLKKGILLTGITLVVLTAISAFSNVQAASGSRYFNIKMIRESGYGYELANSRKNVWKIYEDGGKGETIYCLRGGPGFGSSDMSDATPARTLYSRYFDLKDPNSISSSYLDALLDPNSKDYERLMWVLDNSYVAPKTNASTSDRKAAEENRKMLLDAAIKYAMIEGNPDATDYEFDFLTDDDIDAVQQLAVWHFTNPTGDYHVENTLEFWINSVRDVDGNYGPLSDSLDDGYERAIACQALFDYLVQTPKKAGFSYDYTQSQIVATPAEIANTTVSVQTINGRLAVGPYRINELRDIEYTINAKWIDGNGNEISDWWLIDENGLPITDSNTFKDLAGQNFYVSIPLSTNTTNIQFDIEGTYFITDTQYWSVQNPGAVDQPIVIIEKIKETFSDSTNHGETPETPEFDLALRKFITSIVDINGAPRQFKDRTPAISNTELSSLANGTKTTAEKVHDKNALTVKTGDKVTYTIRIYNEGQVDGYATEVTDYLPAGLKFIPTTESEINRNYGWSNPSGDGKTIVTNYLQDKLMPALNGTNLQYQDLKIECEVIATIQAEDQNLKNIAEITAHKDKDGNTTVKDRDSQPDNVNLNNYGTTSQQDDDDFEHLILKGQYFDLSLRKFIVNVTDIKGKAKGYDRAPKVDVSKLASGTSTTATYNHPKNPVGVSNGDIVTYTIRVYNEGQVDGYVTEITDHLPSQLEFIVSDELNAKYGWTVVAGSNGRKVTTTITSPTTTSSASRDEIYANRVTGNDKVLLKAFDGTKLDYIDVQIRCKVKEEINLYEKITNIAEISNFTDSEGNVVTDRDSQKDNITLPSDETLPNYKDTEIERGDSYIPGQQDDDDFEKLVLQRFDLALRKFITGVVSGDKKTEITSRVPIFTKTEDGKYVYEHTKEPVEVANSNTVIYTLRIFNEGNVDGYAQEVKDDIPEGLEFLPNDELNKTYRWKMYKEDGTETTEVSEAKTIKTDYLSKEQEKTAGDNLIKAFDPETMTMPDYKDVQIAFKVTEPNTSDRIIINTAEIAEDSDKEGNEVDDIDSTPNNDKEGEDDIDIEKIKVKYFDLALRKWVTESIVTYNGKTTVTKTGNKAEDDPETPAKVEIRGSRISKTTVKFKFNIKVTNEGEIAGYVKELIDYVPEGLKFVAKDNPKWREEDGKILTDQLKDTLLQPGESATVEIILTWINSKDNLGEKINWAEIYEDDNEYDSPDIDSTPGNNVKGEDDIDEAPVILSVVTGSTPTYVTLAIASISMMAGGVILIKKFVI